MRANPRLVSPPQGIQVGAQHLMYESRWAAGRLNQPETVFGQMCSQWQLLTTYVVRGHSAATLTNCRNVNRALVCVHNALLELRRRNDVTWEPSPQAAEEGGRSAAEVLLELEFQKRIFI